MAGARAATPRSKAAAKGADLRDDGADEAPLLLKVVCERFLPGTSLARQSWPKAECGVSIDTCTLAVRISRRELREFSLEGSTLHHSRVTNGLLGIRFPAQKFQLLLSGPPPSVCRLFSELLAATEGRRKRAGPDRYKHLQGVASKRRRRSLFSANLRAEAGLPPPPSSKKAGASARSASGALGLGRLTAEEAASLTAEQRKVCEAALRGQSLFFTGGAGTGKSFLLRQLIRALDPATTAVTASTALAASQLGGVTLHKWAAVGRGEGDVVALARELKGKREAMQRWRSTRTLVVDEVSMVDGELFGKLEVLARAVRGSNTPFGGLQLVLTGDFMQLPPVIARGRDPRLCFEVPAWRAVTRTFELTEVFRQKGDSAFCQILNEVRFGELSPSSEELLRERLSAYEGRGDRAVTRLMPLRSEVESVNTRSLADLPGELALFEAFDQGDPEELDHLTGARRIVELKVGALVILTRTVDLRRRLVNGAQGRVTGFAGAGRLRQPKVKFANAGENGQGIEVAVAQENFEVRCGARVLGIRAQLPLDLAWAVSVHKSQGMTLNAIEVCLENVFEHGQAYVALSRARSLDGVFLLGSSDSLRRSVMVNQRCLAFHKRLRAEAAAAAAPAAPAAADSASQRQQTQSQPSSQPRAAAPAAAVDGEESD